MNKDEHELPQTANLPATGAFRSSSEPEDAASALLRQSELLRVTLGSIGDGVLTTDVAGAVMTLNRVAEVLTGWTQDEARGRPIAEVFRIINEETRQSVESPAQRALREGRVVGLANHTLLVARDGPERPIDDSAAPIRDERGRVFGVVLVFRDVTERRRVEETRARFAAIVESSHDVIVSKDLSGVILSWNPEAERLFGYSEAEAIGQSIMLIIPPERRDEERLILERLGRGERIEHYETVRVARDGRRIDMSLTISPVRDAAGRVIGASKIGRDITARKRIEQALRQSEAQFRQLADSLPQIVWTARSDGFIDYYNERWYEFTGFSRDAFGDSSWLPILHPDDAQRCIDTYYGCIRSGGLYQIEYRLRDRRTGGYRWFLGRAFPVRDDQGQIVRWFGTCTDVDDTKRSEERTRFLSDASAELAKLTDYESTLQKIAGLAVPFFADWCAVDILSTDGSVRRLAVSHRDPAKVELVHEADRRYPARLSDAGGVGRVIRTGESEWAAAIPDELLIRLAHDQEHLQIARTLELKSYLCVALKSGGKTFGALTFATAESGRSYNIDDLRAAEDLAHRAVIAIENARLLGALRESDRRKDEFLAMLAHELRNPLAPIRNATEILRAKGPPEPQLVWARDAIERQARQLTRLVDDLLDVSRISRGRLELRKERVALEAVVASAVEASRPAIDGRGHELTVELSGAPIHLDADPLRLAQVLMNLLNNAAKYMNRGGRIWLTTERHDDHALVRVRDTGIGIPPEMLPVIFEMFMQVDRSLERTEGGLGIGLTLVQRLVELHGGSVEAHSAGPGRGSEFVVRLPLAPADEPAPARAPESPAPSKTDGGQRVLVVDDNLDAARSLAMLLKMIGHEVEMAHDGQQAIEAAARLRPDIVLMDIGLPKLNGYEAARRIRGEHGDRVLLIALTGWGQEEDRRRSKEAGFDHHLTKPVDVDTLQQLLARHEPRR